MFRGSLTWLRYRSGCKLSSPWRILLSSKLSHDKRGGGDLRLLVFYSSDLLRKDPQFKVQPNYNHHKSLILKKCLICQGHLRRPTINNKGHVNVRYAAKTFYIKLVHESSQFQYMTLEVDLQETHFPHRLQTVTFKQKTICRFLTEFLAIKNTQLYIQQKNRLLVSFGNGLGAKSGKTNNGNWDETSKKGIQEHHLNNEHFLTFQTREKTGGSSSLPFLEEKDR